MGMGFAPTWLRQVSPLLHKTTLTTEIRSTFAKVVVKIKVTQFRLPTGHSATVPSVSAAFRVFFCHRYSLDGLCSGIKRIDWLPDFPEQQQVNNPDSKEIPNCYKNCSDLVTATRRREG